MMFFRPPVKDIRKSVDAGHYENAVGMVRNGTKLEDWPGHGGEWYVVDGDVWYINDAVACLVDTDYGRAKSEYGNAPYFFRNWEGKRTEAPADLPIVVANLYDGYIVWSRDGGRHRVRYGLSVKDLDDSVNAAHLVGESVHHHAECEGRLDRETYPEKDFPSGSRRRS